MEKRKCFFCGRDNNEIARIKEQRKQEGKADIVLDYEPCEVCKKVFAPYVIMLGVAASAPDNRPPVTEGSYPTGAYVIAKNEFIRGITPEEKAEEVIKAGLCFVEHDILMDMPIKRSLIKTGTWEEA